MLERFGLGPYAEHPAGSLPEGIRKLLDVAMALVGKPKLLLLDEPTSGVAADEKFGIMDLVMDAAARPASSCCSSSTTWISSRATPSAWSPSTTAA